MFINILDNHHHYALLEHFRHCKKKLHIQKKSLLILYSPSYWQPPIYFLSLWMGLFWTFHIMESHMWPFESGFLIYHNGCIKVHLCYSMNQYFIPSSWSIISHCMDHHISLSHLSVDGHLGCSHFLPIMDNAVMNIYVHVFVWTYDFSSLRDIPRGGIAELHHESVSNVLRSCQTICPGSCTTLHPYQQHEVSDFSTLLLTLVIVCLYYSHPGECEMVSHWGSDLHFPND